MRIKTMNSKINVSKQDISYVLKEFTLKLEKYLMDNYIDATAHVSCYKVMIQPDDLLPQNIIHEIEKSFMLELDEYDVTYSSNYEITEVCYYFNHTKPS